MPALDLCRLLVYTPSMNIKYTPTKYKLPILSHDWSGTSENCEHCKRENRLFDQTETIKTALRYQDFLNSQVNDLLDRTIAAVRGCKHEDWDLQMDATGRTWTVCNDCGEQGD